MDPTRFERLTKALTAIPSRREVLRGLAGAGLGLGAMHLPDLANAKKKRKRKKRKKKVKPAQPNSFGCFEVDDPCTSEEDCCSGICEVGKKGKRTCRAHGTDICRQDEPGVCTAPIDDIPSLGCGVSCACFRTTAGSNFCTVGVYTSQANCTDCKTDADCLALGFPEGSACAPVGRGAFCNGFCDTGMACLLPCGVELPEPTT